MASTLNSEESERVPSWLWFIGGGTVAVLVAVVAVYVVHAPLWFIRWILPSSMLIFDPSPSDFTKDVVLFFLLFGVTFLLYGTAGWLLGRAIQGWRS